MAKTGIIPQPVDVDLKTYNIDPEKIKQVIDSKTKAIIVTHLYGQPIELKKIIPNDIPIIFIPEHI